MATSSNPGHGKPSRSRRQSLEGLLSLSRYDLLLVLIPLGFVVAFLGHVVFALSLQQAVAVGGLIGMVSVVDALFLNPPAEPPRNAPRR